MEEELDFEDEKCTHEEEEEKDEVVKESVEKDNFPDKMGLKDEVNAGEKCVEEEDQLANFTEQSEIKQSDRDDDEEGEDGSINDDDNEIKNDGEDPQSVKNGPLNSAEEGEDDDGEIVDDELEEGEVKDTTSFTVEKQQKQVCRFFNRYQCTWGNMCKFLHISPNEHGNYNMFEQSNKVVNYNVVVPPPPHPVPLRNVQEYIPPMPPLPPPPVPVSEPTPVESAWERGLRQARELLQKSMRRKQQEPDFEEKRMNLTLKEREKERTPDDYEDKEFPVKLPRHPIVKRGSPEDEDLEEVDERWGGGHYENFEIRTRADTREDRREKERSRNFPRVPIEQERPKPRPPGRNWKEERISELETRRARADEWRDPWRRSKSPKGRSRSRNGSRSSYSSISSRSYSGRSSPSYRSYSRSRSRSSGESRRRRAGSRGRYRSRSKSHSLSRSRSYSTRSRSFTGTPSRSRSRSYSRSLSMDSVSSASSSNSPSSSRSESLQNRNTLGSVLYKGAAPAGPGASSRNGVGNRSPPRKIDSKYHKSEVSNELEEKARIAIAKKSIDSGDTWGGKLSHSSVPVSSVPLPPTTAANSVSTTSKPPPLPPAPAPKDSSKQYVPKQQQIKLTLLNKPLPAKIPNPLKKDVVEPVKGKPEKVEKSNLSADRKQSSAGTKVTGVALKRSTSSRRDELLKQLKAVEDAIARKRSKC